MECWPSPTTSAGRRIAAANHLEADHQDAQVQAFVEAFEQDPAVELTRCFNRLLHLFDGLQVHRHALALFTIQRFDHDALVLVEELQVVVGAARPLLRRQFQPGGLEHLVGQAFVLAQGHADGAGQVAQRFTAAHAAPAMAEGEQAGIGVVYLHVDATAMGFFDDDPRVRVEPRLRAGPRNSGWLMPFLRLIAKVARARKPSLA